MIDPSTSPPGPSLRALVLSAAVALTAPALSGAEPPPPEEPPLPSGLGGEEPALPRGLGQETSPREAESNVRAAWPVDVTGFVEARGGQRTREDSESRDTSMAEIRFQTQLEKGWDRATARLTADLLFDPIYNDDDVKLETGQGWLDLREAFVTLRAASFLDLKLGRQILTWGTGDLIFINDMFPKDWNSFFIGRDTEYLKAPSDALKASVFAAHFSLDLVYTPRFDPDRYIDGERISFFNPVLMRRSGRDDVLRVDKPESWMRDDEIAIRLAASLGALELRAYGYRGFWKSPGGLDSGSALVTFPRLAVLGASVRGPLAAGIVNVELGFYLSQDDSGGTDPEIRNSEFRLLVGYERELRPDFTAGFQYYLEQLLDYGDYRRALPGAAPTRDESRHVFTLRLTRLLLQQNLELSFFGYWSPSDRDAYLRPHVGYQLDDNWSIAAGANFFMGSDETTFFGQFERNSNVYFALRYGF